MRTTTSPAPTLQLAPLFAATALILSLPAHAQSGTLRFAGGAHPDIPLLSSADLVLLPSGSYEGRCALTSGTTRCQGVAAGGGGTPGPLPTASLTGASSASTGTAISVTRSTGNAPELCVASSSPSAGVTGWSGSVGPTAGTSSVTFSSTGTYSLSMRCYNANGATTSNSLSITVSQGGGTPGNCSISHPQIRPAGLTEYLMTWNQVFERNYPAAPGYLIPLGSFTPERSMNGPLSSKMYLAIAFTAQAGVVGNIAFAGSQPIPAVGYTEYRPGTAFVTVSPCAGDFRPQDSASNDMFVRNCRLTVEEGAFFFGNSPSPSSAYCQLTPGQTYYLNVVMGPPGGLNGFNNSCNPGLQRCEVNAQPR